MDRECRIHVFTTFQLTVFVLQLPSYHFYLAAPDPFSNSALSHIPEFSTTHLHRTTSTGQKLDLVAAVSFAAYVFTAGPRNPTRPSGAITIVQIQRALLHDLCLEAKKIKKIQGPTGSRTLLEPVKEESEDGGADAEASCAEVPDHDGDVESEAESVADGLAERCATLGLDVASQMDQDDVVLMYLFRAWDQDAEW